MKVSVAHAKNKLPQLIRAAEDGEPVTIWRRGVPEVDLVRTTTASNDKPKFGTLKGTGIAALRLRVLPYTANHALHLFDLPAHPGDPFDRQIIAQALCEKIAVLTSDQKFSLYKGLRIVW